MPDEIDDFFAERDAVADQVEQECVSTHVPAEVPLPVVADSIAAVAPTSNDTAAKALSDCLDDFFGQAPAAGAVQSGTGTARWRLAWGCVTEEA